MRVGYSSWSVSYTHLDVYKRQGIGFGFLTLAAHMHKNFPVGHPGYMGRLVYAQDVLSLIHIWYCSS